MKLFLTALLVFSAGTLSARAEERLLPTAQENNVSISFRQDSRAVYVSLANNSTFVVTSAKVKCWYIVGGNVRIEAPDFQTLRLVPGRAAEAYFEADGKINSCSINELRGREKKFYELL